MEFSRTQLTPSISFHPVRPTPLAQGRRCARSTCSGAALAGAYLGKAGLVGATLGRPA